MRSKLPRAMTAIDAEILHDLKEIALSKNVTVRHLVTQTMKHYIRHERNRAAAAKECAGPST